MRYQRSFFLVFAAGAVATHLAFNALCLWLDPFNVIWRRPAVAREGWAIEQFRHAKIEHLAQNPAQYNGLILADSRGTLNNTGQFNAATGNRFFNLSVSADSPYGFAQKAHWIARTQKNVRTVIIFLWYDQFYTELQPDWLTRREHPDVSGESWLSYYWAFANLPANTFWPSFRHLVKRVAGLATDSSVIVNDGLDASGDVTIWGPHFAPDSTPEKRREFAALAAADPPGRLRFQNQTIEGAAGFKEKYTTPFLKVQIAGFRDAVRTLQAADIQAECVAVPQPAAVVKQVPPDRYLDWLQLVIRECGYVWDFSFPTALTRDNFNFLDAIHFTPQLANLVITKVSGARLPVLDEHPDFGRRITEADFPAHAAKWNQFFRGG